MRNGLLLLLLGLLLITPWVLADEAKILVNGKEVAKISVYTPPNNSKRYVKTTTRKALNSCLTTYPPEFRTRVSYINFCLCKLEYGARKCNR